MNELQKEYCVKRKLVSLDWQWGTLIYWIQTNRDNNSSPVMHQVEGKIHKNFTEIKCNIFNIDLILNQICEVFSDHLCWWQFKYITHIWLCVDLVFALLLTIQWFRFGFGLCRWTSKKTTVLEWLHRKVHFSEKFGFWQLLGQS